MREQNCSVGKMLELLEEFLQKDLCGRCTPCRLGIFYAMNLLQKIRKGDGKEEDINTLCLIFERVEKMALCKKGQDVAKNSKEMLSSQIAQFFEHVKEKRCTALLCNGCISYRIKESECNMCGACKKVCEFDAIIGYCYVPYLTDNRPFKIREKSCRKCGRCIEVCPKGAIELVSGGEDG
jgi:ferredoxin